MKRIYNFLIGVSALAVMAPAAGAQTLIVRGDDIGGSHGSNMGVIKAYQEGIEHTTEIYTLSLHDALPIYTKGSIVFDLEGQNIMFSGDAIGSGNGCWIF